MIVSRFSCFFFFKQKTAYELRISDWSSDVCSSDLTVAFDSFLAFPMAKFADPAAIRGEKLSVEEAQRFDRWRPIGLCADASGAMQAAVDFTVGHVTERRQFGRPLGPFQAIQHRLSELTVQQPGSRRLREHGGGPAT